MIFLLAFLFSGTLCFICQIILDNTKLTPGHITSGVTVVGAVLSFLGVYGNLIEKFGAGATIVISNFGHLLFTAGYEGYVEKGILGIFSNLLSFSSVAIVSSLLFSFIFTLFFKSRD